MTGERIIAPVTFALDSLETAAVAAELAVALGAELVLAGIAPVAPFEPSYESPSELEALQRPAEHQRLLDQIMASSVKNCSKSAAQRRSRHVVGRPRRSSLGQTDTQRTGRRS
jgi:hypothetical protein